MIQGAQARYEELGIFPEDTEIPVSAVETLWAATAKYEHAQTVRLLRDMADLSLISYRTDREVITLHDVFLSFLYHELGRKRPAVHARFLDAAASSIAQDNVRVQWWHLDSTQAYLWDRVTYHLSEAGRREALSNLVTDLRWITLRMARSGVAACLADLSRATSVRASSLQRIVGKYEHLLSPTLPKHSLINVLLSRLADEPEWRPDAEKAMRVLAERHPVLISRWDLPDDVQRSQLRQFNYLGKIRTLAMSSDAGRLVCAGTAGTAWVRDAITGEQLSAIDCGGRWLNAVAIQADDRLLAVGGIDRNLRVVDMKTGEIRTTIMEYTHTLTAIASVRRYGWIVTGSLDGGIRVRTLDGKGLVRGWHAHNGGVLCLAVSADGSWIASGGADGSVAVWDAETGQQFRRSQLAAAPDSKRRWGEARGGPVRAVTIAPDGSWLAAGNDSGNVMVLDFVSQPLAGRHLGAVNCMAIIDDGQRLASGGSDGTILIWDRATLTPIAELRGHIGAVRALIALPGRNRLVSGGDDGVVRVWEIPSSDGEPEPTPVMAKMSTVAFSPSCQLVATYADAATVDLWDLESRLRTEVMEVKGPSAFRPKLWMSPDAAHIAVLRDLESTMLWTDAKPLPLSRDLPFAGAEPKTVRVLDLTPDRVHLVCTYDGRLAALNLETGAWKTPSGIVRFRVREASVTPDGRRVLATTDDGHVTSWNLMGESDMRSEGFHDEPLHMLALSGDGMLSVVCTASGRLHVRETSTWSPRATLEGLRRPAESLAISPNGRWVVACDGGQSLWLWDAQVQRLATVIPMNGLLSSCAWPGDGSSLVAVGSRGMYVFELAGPGSARA